MEYIFRRYPPPAVLTGVFLLASLPFVLVELFPARPPLVLDRASYLVFHNVAEFFSVIVSFSVFGVGWYTFDQSRNRHALFLSVAFVAIGLMDFMHTLGYAGMPAFITPNSANKSTQFWIAVRFFTATTFLGSAFVYPDRQSRWLAKPVLMTAALTVSTLVFTAITFFPELTPATFVEGAGLTPFKKVSEYVIIGLLLLAVAAYWQRLKQTGERVLLCYLVAFVLCIFSELVFAAYQSVFDTFNVLGHIYKVVAFLFIYEGIFATSVTYPYDHLAEAREKLRMEVVERRQAEEARRESEELFHGFAEAADEVFWITNVHPERVLYVNPAFERIWGRRVEELYGDARLWTNDICPDDRPGVVESFGKWLEGAGGARYDAEYRIVRPDGDMRWIVDRGFVVQREGDRISRVAGIAADVTGHKNLEKQLRQAQKMEAVGTLAGGVAHDFNNILTAIIGYASLMEMKMPEDTPLRVNVVQILAAADRAADLTRSLLAFSRQQSIKTQPVSLNEVVAGMEKMLRRLVREDIDLQIIPATEAPVVLADAGQLGQVLLNLTTNARDAMPAGGTISIATGLVDLDEEFSKVHGFGEPGVYALLTFADNGTGMEERVRQRIFEPFFTTKEVGKGTGLGLCVCYGIVKQHSGYINCYSEPGQGTTFRIYLPLIGESAPPREEPPAIRPERGTETVLVAEDDAVVRSLTGRILEEFGYTVIEARDGAEAVETFRGHRGKIHLCLLDIIMPKMNGWQAYEEMRKMEPGVRALFMSGYQADVSFQNGLVKEGAEFIAKPVVPRELLRKVRELLDRIHPGDVS